MLSLFTPNVLFMLSEPWICKSNDVCDYFPYQGEQLLFLLPNFRHVLNVCRILHTPTCLWRWNRQSVLKRRHIKFRCRGITQKKAYSFCFACNCSHVHHEIALVRNSSHSRHASAVTSLSGLLVLMRGWNY